MSLRLVANWKLNGSIKFIKLWSQQFLENFNGDNFNSIGIAPSSLHFSLTKDLLLEHGINIGVQNIDVEQSGARTGEISASMVKDLGGVFSIIGHSERRVLFHESVESISSKLAQAYLNNIVPILCIGESFEENKANITQEVLEGQIIDALKDHTDLSSLIIAYEPIWAIGTGVISDPKDINSVHEMIKDVVQSRFPKTGLESVIYGGSVNKSNALDLFKQKNIDGALIGGASLDGKDFALIANIFNKLKV